MKPHYVRFVNEQKNIDKQVSAHLNIACQELCDKWELRYFAGMGTFGFSFAEDITVIVGVDEDGLEIDATVSTSDYFPDMFHLIEDIEHFDEMRNDVNTFLDEAREVADALDKKYSEWFLDGLDDYNGGFTYKNGYPNPNKVEKYYVRDHENASY